MPQDSSLRARGPSVLAGGVAVLIVLGAAMAPAQTARPDSWPEQSLYRDVSHFTDDAGARLDMSSFQGRQVILTMFYTRCQSASSITVDKLCQIDKAFAERSRPVEIVLVSYGRYLDMGDDIFHAFRIVLLDETGVLRRALESRRDKVLSPFEDEGRNLRSPEDR